MTEHEIEERITALARDAVDALWKLAPDEALRPYITAWFAAKVLTSAILHGGAGVSLAFLDAMGHHASSMLDKLKNRSAN